MSRQADRERQPVRRAAMDFYVRRRGSEHVESGQDDVQQVPINVYETEEDVVIVAPMPGVEPDNIDIQVLGSCVTLRSTLRGKGQRHRDYLIHEWTYGPYERRVTLPMEVDASHANASHGNGLLVLTLPKSGPSRSVRVPLKTHGSDRATTQGHSGHHTSRKGLEE